AFDSVALGVRLSGWLGALTLGATAYGLYAGAAAHRWERGLSPLILLLGIYLWAASGLTLVADRVAGDFIPSALLGFFAVSAWAFAAIGLRLRWPALGAAALPLHLGTAALILPFYLVAHEHPFAYAGWLMWPLAFGLLAVILRRREGVSLPRRLGLGHAAALWLLALVATTEAA